MMMMHPKIARGRHLTAGDFLFLPCTRRELSASLHDFKKRMLLPYYYPVSFLLLYIAAHGLLACLLTYLLVFCVYHIYIYSKASSNATSSNAASSNTDLKDTRLLMVRYYIGRKYVIFDTFPSIICQHSLICSKNI